MTREPLREGEPVGVEGLPIDADLAPAVEAPSSRRGASRWPRLRASVLAAVFVGGCLGGLARYAVTSSWPTPAHAFPWAVLTVNTSGAFLLAVIVVIAVDLVPSRFVRPLLGTGFCGAFTTLSSVVVGADQLVGAHRTGTAAAYVAATVVAGFAAAVLGLITARAVTGRRERRPAIGAPTERNRR